MTVTLFALALALASPPEPPGLAARWSAHAGGALLGVAAVHAESGRAETLNAATRFAMASTYKLPIAVAVERAVEKGTLSLDAEVRVRPEDVRRGMGSFSPRRARPSSSAGCADEGPGARASVPASRRGPRWPRRPAPSTPSRATSGS